MTRPNLHIFLLFLFLASLLTSCQTTKPQGIVHSWGNLDLDEAIEKMTSDLVLQGRLSGKEVMISPHDLFDGETGLSLPLATLLRGKLMAEMKARDVQVILPGVDEDRVMILQGTWQQVQENLDIQLKVMRLGYEGPEAVAATTAQVPLRVIDRKMLVPDRGSWAKYLVRQLEKAATDRVPRRIHLSRFNINGSNGYAMYDLSYYLADWLRPALAESRLFLPLDQARELRKLSKNQIRTRGSRVRGIGVEIDKTTSLTADLLQADAELKGSAWMNSNNIEIHLQIVGQDGAQVSATAVEIPTSLFPARLLKKNRSLFPTGQVKNNAVLSRNFLTVDLTTTRGESPAVYRDGEAINFVVRLNRLAWLYLFVLDSKNNATLIYPVDVPGMPNKCSGMLDAGEALLLPDDGCSYDLVSQKPYGKDRVVAVGAESPLDFPPNLPGEWSDPDVLIKRLRDQGVNRKDGYAEAEIELVARP